MIVLPTYFFGIQNPHKYLRWNVGTVYQKFCEGRSSWMTCKMLTSLKVLLFCWIFTSMLPFQEFWSLPMCASKTCKYRLQKEQKGVFVMKQLIKVSWHQFIIFEFSTILCIKLLWSSGTASRNLCFCDFYRCYWGYMRNEKALLLNLVTNGWNIKTNFCGLWSLVLFKDGKMRCSW
jgi:hypothetical protein